ncbi:class I SAM-dependent methyltransferase [Halalkalibacter wakoensis]|nr:methyltransferase domain-containing protein [Halalkalibacter wakoensis]
MPYSYVDLLGEFQIGSAHPGGFDRTKAVLQKESFEKEMKVLDVGCGTGDSAFYIAKTFNCHVVGLEHHPVMIRTLEQRKKKEQTSIQIIEGTVENLPFDSKMFDFVLCESLLAFVDINQALNECYRVLKDNGTLIINEMIVKDMTIGDRETFKEFYGVKELHDETQLVKKIERAGFKTIKPFHNSSPLPAQPIDIQLTPNIDPELLHVLDTHVKIQKELGKNIESIVLKCKK